MNTRYLFRLPDNITVDKILREFHLRKILENDRTTIFENSQMRFCFNKSVVRVMIFDKGNKELAERIRKYFYGEEVQMKPMKVMEVTVGETVKVAGINWVVLEHIEGKGTLCLMRDILEERAFHNKNEGGCNNWANSSLREYLNSEFAARLLDRQLVEMEVDLITDYGMTDYGKTKDYIALLTADQYRKYRSLIPEADDWWWLATPWTCDSDNSCYVRGVFASGTLNVNSAYLDYIGVRPALIFKESVIADDDNPAERSEADIKDWKEVEETAVKVLAELDEMADTIESYKDTITDLLNSIHNR